jgi:hypothetical protein
MVYGYVDRAGRVVIHPATVRRDLWFLRRSGTSSGQW